MLSYLWDNQGKIDDKQEESEAEYNDRQDQPDVQQGQTQSGQHNDLHGPHTGL